MDKAVSIPEIFGSAVFSEDVMRQTLPPDVFASLINTVENGTEIDPGIADVVASAMKDWAIKLGATHFTHWFQPLTGVTAEKHDSFVSPAEHGRAIMEFSGKELIKGEPDASSFPSGGLRATFEARGYTSWDPASFAFVKDGSLYIPTVFCSYTGESLDTKTPLLRSIDALNTEGVRLLRALGDKEVSRITPTVGAEQEYFLVDADDFKARKDLFFCGRTLFGAPAVKGQELDDHYFGALRPKVSAFMKALDYELWTLGICSKTKHNEVAPAQHELAPVFCSTNRAVDQNLLTMEYMKRLAPKFGMECLLAEKPFDGINGSGKHNNWSLSTDTGRNLLKPGRRPAENKEFLTVLAAVIKAVDDYQDLLRISAASAGNDHRLGGNEAPPAIISIFLGEELEDIVDSLIAGSKYENRESKYMTLGLRSVPNIRQDKTDRNRTSPFAFTGNKFEFRMVGSSQNIAFANIVLNTAVAKSFADFADVLEGAKDFDAALSELLGKTFRDHSRILFSGNSYSAEWEKEAKARGLSVFKSAPEAYAHFTDEKNVKLFSKFGVMTETEMNSRRSIFFENYRKIVGIEARTMVEMTVRDILPAVSKYVTALSESVTARRAVIAGAPAAMEEEVIGKLSALMSEAYDAANVLAAAEKTACSKATEEDSANAYLTAVIPKMAELRSKVDAMEVLTSREYWPMPTYGDLTFRV
ncbi:MAG: glutamine synthetase III [Clostridia bacterium]|nr:glutamine synthetase III [Clostridia bacterium]